MDEPAREIVRQVAVRHDSRGIPCCILAGMVVPGPWYGETRGGGTITLENSRVHLRLEHHPGRRCDQAQRYGAGAGIPRGTVYARRYVRDGATRVGADLLLWLGATVLAPLAWRVPALAVLGGAGLVGCLLRSRTRRWSILSAARPGAGGHRGPTHSLLGRGRTTAVGLLRRATIVWGARPRGVLSHLLLDTLTWGGVPWLWPWRKHFRARWALHTGSFMENVVVFPLLLITAVAEGLVLLPAGGLC